LAAFGGTIDDFMDDFPPVTHELGIVMLKTAGCRVNGEVKILPGIFPLPPCSQPFAQLLCRLLGGVDERDDVHRGGYPVRVSIL
jgi:hypothetical protein